jgi:hypothetical protein
LKLTTILPALPVFPSSLPQGKERYVFFSFPHIAVDSEGKIGAIARPNRPGASAACGALIKCMLDLKAEGVDANVSSPGTHDPLEPEYSILKSRMARRIKYEKGDVQEMTLVDITKVAERVITTVSACAAAAVGLACSASWCRGMPVSACSECC